MACAPVDESKIWKATEAAKVGESVYADPHRQQNWMLDDRRIAISLKK